MRRLFAAVLFFVAATAYGQTNIWQPWSSGWVPWNGGNPAVTGVTSVYDEGTLLTPPQAGINFIGSTVTCVTNAGAQRVDCTFSGSAAHALLDGSANNDTLAGVPVRGSVIVANSTPLWAATVVGTKGQYLGTINGTDTVFTDPYLDSGTQLFANENFCNPSTFTSNLIGAGTIGNSTSSDNNHPCTRLLNTTTAAATGIAITWANTTGASSAITSWGQGQIDFLSIFQLSSIGDGTDVVKVFHGFCNQIADATECTSGIYVMYDRAVSTTNWVLVAAKASVYTRTDTGIAVTVGSMTKIQMTLNAAGTSLTCIIGGVACATPVTTNIPTAGASVQVKLDKTAGVTTAFTMNMNKVVAIQHGLNR